MNIVDETVENRGKAYGDSWLTPTLALQAITQGDLTKLEPLINSGHFYNWFMILAKLCRAMNSPQLLDNWVDMGGYAQIAIRELTKS